MEKITSTYIIIMMERISLKYKLQFSMLACQHDDRLDHERENYLERRYFYLTRCSLVSTATAIILNKMKEEKAEECERKERKES